MTALVQNVVNRFVDILTTKKEYILGTYLDYSDGYLLGTWES